MHLLKAYLIKKYYILSTIFLIRSVNKKNPDTTIQSLNAFDRAFSFYRKKRRRLTAKSSLAGIRMQEFGEKVNEKKS